MDLPELKAGYTVRLHLRISEGKKDRVQIFEGIILSMQGKSAVTRTFTVRKKAKGYGVEKIIPLAMPTLEKIEVVKKAKVRKQRLYYLRDYGKRLKEEIVTTA
jgi:large subunit ribosomal protein L19